MSASDSEQSEYLAEDKGGLKWGVLVKGVLVRRYKRFLADVTLEDGRLVTAHTPNTGSMLACSQPGRPVWLSPQDRPDRKLKYTWEVIEMPKGRVGVNTGVPNRLVKIAALAGKIPDLAGYDLGRAEVKTSAHSRLDLVLEAENRRTCYIEIKNCTLVEDRIAYFPDAVTSRGRKHLDELAGLAAQGNRAVIFFLVQRTDAAEFRPADHIDPEYGRTLREVKKQGVEALAYDVRLTRKRIDINQALPVVL